MPTVNFVKEKKKVEVPKGANLRKVAMQNGVNLYWGPSKVLNCHGFGHCGSCRVRISKGADQVSKQGWFEKLRLILGPISFWARLNKEKETRLACRTQVLGDCEVETQTGLNVHGEKFWG
jgi:ferredoxin